MVSEPDVNSVNLRLLKIFTYHSMVFLHSNTPALFYIISRFLI